MSDQGRYGGGSQMLFDGTGDTQELQTDVMRFMAILGLCLTAIFAVVSSLPLHPADDRPQLESRVQLMQEAQSLQAQVAALKQQILLLQEQRDAVREALQRAREQALSIDAQTRELESVRANRRQELASMLGEIAEQRQRLQALQQQIQSQGQSLTRVRRSLERERQSVQRLQAQARELQPPAEKVAPVAAPPPPPATAPGFSLRFASDAALLQLVRRGDVGFFAMVGRQAWRLQLTDGDPSFVPDANPASFHEMTPVTVPRALVHALQRRVAVFDLQKVTWGVRLPAGIARDVQRRLRQEHGGTLVIQANGSLTLERG